ncbi:MAG: AAA family ATPase, partial [Pseudomonadales bacterium]
MTDKAMNGERPLTGKDNPFQAGYGLTPPYMAGREEQQALFAEKVAAMTRGRSVNGVVMYGPRGTGKTTLLRWLERHCEEKRIVPLTTTPARGLKSVDDLARLLLPPKWLPDEVSLSAGSGMRVEAKWINPQTKQEGMLEDHLTSLCQQRPRALLVDEAHDLVNPAFYKELLHISQTVADKAPFLLALAGTPGLNAHLRQIQATFIERAKKIGIGCLAEGPATDAVCVPLQAYNISLQDEALDSVVQDAQGYPFFLQQWGEALWRRAAAKSGKLPRQSRLARFWFGGLRQEATELTQEDVNIIEEGVQRERTAFYKSRYDEMMSHNGLLDAANAVAAAFKQQVSLEDYDVLAAIEKTLAADAPDEGDS